MFTEQKNMETPAQRSPRLKAGKRKTRKDFLRLFSNKKKIEKQKYILDVPHFIFKSTNKFYFQFTHEN